MPSVFLFCRNFNWRPVITITSIIIVSCNIKIRHTENKSHSKEIKDS